MSDDNSSEDEDTIEVDDDDNDDDNPSEDANKRPPRMASITAKKPKVKFEAIDDKDAENMDEKEKILLKSEGGIEILINGREQTADGRDQPTAWLARTQTRLRWCMATGRPSVLARFYRVLDTSSPMLIDRRSIKDQDLSAVKEIISERPDDVYMVFYENTKYTLPAREMEFEPSQFVILGGGSLASVFSWAEGGKGGRDTNELVKRKISQEKIDKLMKKFVGQEE